MLVEGPLGALESLLNRQIAASTPARTQLDRLQGRAFAVSLTTVGQPGLRVCLSAFPEGLRLSLGETPADAEVRGSPFQLLRLLGGRGDGGHHEPGVRIEGDAMVAQSFESLFRHARPDVEAELARLWGDSAALVVSRVGQRLLQRARQVSSSLSRSGAEFLLEEGRDVVGRDELGEFHAAVDDLRDDVARFEARLNRLVASRGEPA